MFSETLELDVLEPVGVAFQMLGTSLAFIALMGAVAYGVYRMCHILLVSWQMSHIERYSILELIFIIFKCKAGAGIAANFWGMAVWEPVSDKQSHFYF